MNKETIKACSILCLIIGIIFIGVAFEKKINYSNGESYPYETANAYVGGDAYNYIINANYFTGYMVLGCTLEIIATMLMGMAIYLDKQNECNKSNEVVVTNLNADDNDLPNEQTELTT